MDGLCWWNSSSKNGSTKKRAIVQTHRQAGSSKATLMDPAMRKLSCDQIMKEYTYI
jgi:hypothetical protein